jgi:nitronate monooxygenase
MPIATRLTERFGLDSPILSAPMGTAAGGALSAAVSNAGGLGIIGGGYGDAGWLDREFAAAGNARVGCGFITWSLAKNPALLDHVLARKPAALMLSFGAIGPLARPIADAGVPLICQVQTLQHVREAVDAGAAAIVAQGSEAGGHGGSRATLTFVPEVADFLASTAPQTLLVAAGGIADGRGLAAALMLGADGVLLGSRFLAATEAILPDGYRSAIVAANGDATVRTTVVDIVRNFPWPAEFTGRALNNRFVQTWHGREADLAEPAVNKAENERFWAAARAGDAENAGVFVGEAAGLIHAIEPAAAIMDRMIGDAEDLLGQAGTRYLRA